MKTKLCRPVLVESKEQTILALDSFNKLFYCDSKFNFKDCKYQQLILISLDPNEKIEVGDTYYNLISGKINSCESESIKQSLNICKSHAKKVIALQSQLSPEYIQQFIEEYNEGEVKDVEIEMVTMNKGYNNHEDSPYNEIDIPKLTNGFVTIVEKPIYQQIIDTCGGEEAFCKLVGINKEPKFYTEDEIKSLIAKIVNELRLSPEFNVKEWFNQNKK